jgi:hypothetical protein
MRALEFLAIAMVLVVHTVSPKPGDDSEPLRVTASLIDQSYCVGDADLYSVNLRLRLRFRNSGDQNLILDRGIGTLRITARERRRGHQAVQRIQGELEPEGMKNMCVSTRKPVEYRKKTWGNRKGI